LKKVKQERDEYLEGWKRAKADFLNYKKEEGERVGRLTAGVKEEVLKSLLPMIESMERAEAAISKTKKDKALTQGFVQTFAQLKSFLEEQGFEEIDEKGQFNPEVHEAVLEGTKEGKKSGEIIEVLEKGYILNGKVIRPAKVKVTK